MNKLLLSRANTRELNDVVTIVVDAVDKSAYKDDKLTKLNVKLKKEGDDLTVAQNRKRKNDLTDVVEGLKKEREHGFKAFSFTTKGLTFRKDETLSTNSNLIYEVIKRHGLSLYNLPNMEQNAQMKSLRTELNKPEYKAAMDITGLTVVFDEMNLLDQKYQEGVANRTDSEQKMAEEVTENVAEASKKTKATLDALVGYLNSCVAVDESVELKKIYEKIEMTIDKANINIHSRINRGKNGSNGTEADELDDELEEDI